MGKNNRKFGPRKTRWTKSKKRIESTFADSVRGRVQVWTTWYGEGHDTLEEFWLTFDKGRVVSIGAGTFYREVGRRLERLHEETDATAFNNRDALSGMVFWTAAEKGVRESGLLTPEEVRRALSDYPQLSIDDIIGSKNPVIRAFGMLDRRFGKRRVRSFDTAGEHPLVRTLHGLRCEAERSQRTSGQVLA